MPITSPLMGLTIPLYRDPSPGYVNSFFASLGVLDVHDHSTGKGAQVPSAGININADLPYNSHNATALRSVIFNNNGAPLGLGTDQYSVYVAGGNLYYNFGSAQVQLTAGNALNASLLGGFGGQYAAAGAVAFYDAVNLIYSFYQGGGVNLADGQFRDLFLAGPTPFVDYKDTNGGALKMRTGTSDANTWCLSIDSNSSGAVDSSKRYSATPTALCAGIAAGAIAMIGVNCAPSTGTLQVQSTGSGGGLPTNIAQFTNTTAAATMTLTGGTTATSNITGATTGALAITGNSGNATITATGTSAANVTLSGGATAAMSLSSPTTTATVTSTTNAVTATWRGVSVSGANPVTHTLSNGTQTAGLSLLGTATAAAGDLSVGTATNFVCMKQSGGSAVNKFTASDAWDINGDIRALGGFRCIFGPFGMNGSFSSGTTYSFAIPATVPNSAGVGASANGLFSQFPMPFAGSLMGVAGSLQASSGTGAGTINMSIAGGGPSALPIGNTSGTSTTYYNTTYAKDTYTFAAGNFVIVTFSATQTFTGFLTCAIWIEC